MPRTGRNAGSNPLDRSQTGTGPTKKTFRTAASTGAGEIQSTGPGIGSADGAGSSTDASTFTIASILASDATNGCVRTGVVGTYSLRRSSIAGRRSIAWLYDCLTGFVCMA